MIYGYIRVSTDKQTMENQRQEIERYCKNNNIKIDKWFEETISGTKNYKNRKLGILLKKIKKDDIILITEISRFARNLYMLIEIISICLKTKSKLISVRDNFVFGDNIQSKILIFAFGLSAEIERQLISQRTKEGLLRVKNLGIKLGRPIGHKNINNKLNSKIETIKKLREQKISYIKMAKILKCHRSTISKFCKENNL